MANGGRITDSDLGAACIVSALQGDASDDTLATAKQLAAPALVPGARGSRTAIVSFRGLVTYDIEFQPYAVSTRAFASTMRELAADDSIKQIVVMFDSPGGSVVGLPEAGDAMFDARERKRVVAVVDNMCASAAYWVASQASEIVALPSGTGVGSVGVRMMHVDCSKAMSSAGVKMTHIYSGDYKVEGNPYEALSEDARARYQLESDTLYAGFLAAVARGRGAKVSDVRENYGKGRLLMPAEAKRVGMVDKLETPENALRRLGVLISPSGARAVADEVAPVAEVDDAPVAADAGNDEAPSAPAVDDAAPADAALRPTASSAMNFSFPSFAAKNVTKSLIAVTVELTKPANDLNASAALLVNSSNSGEST
jgi:signal peptide peptidase SppA